MAVEELSIGDTTRYVGYHCLSTQPPAIGWEDDLRRRLMLEVGSLCSEAECRLANGKCVVEGVSDRSLAHLAGTPKWRQRYAAARATAAVELAGTD